MFNADQILQARQNRCDYVAHLAKTQNVLTVKANIPGDNKRIPEAYALVRLFGSLVADLTIGKPTFLDGADGPCLVYEAADNAKISAVELEESHPLGRFIDIDVYEKGSSRSLTRGSMRKCYVCDKPAFVCGRTHAHSVEQLTSSLIQKTERHVNELLNIATRDAMLTELNLENKFGLVTPTSCGSHSDMNYRTMIDAQDAIVPFIVNSFWTGARSSGDDELLSLLRPDGIKAEKAMLDATCGVNAYKGLIFVAMLLVAAVGRAVATGKPVDYAYEIVKQSSRGITEELKCADTFGGKAYRSYGITGARGQAEQGFPAVKFAEQMLEDGFSPLQVLTKTVGQTDDTVLLKRSGSAERYEYFKKLISRTDVNDSNKLLQTNRECLAANVSIGGSADILVAAVLQKNLSKLFVSA